MDLYSIAEVKECCHAPLASFNARLAEKPYQSAGLHRLDGPRPNVSYWRSRAPQSRRQGGLLTEAVLKPPSALPIARADKAALLRPASP